jgi:hypothetical protein
MSRAPNVQQPAWRERGVVEVTAAATITIPATDRITLCRIVGNTNISSITANEEDRGRVVILRFSGTPTVIQGSNLEMPANFVATAKDALMFGCFDGANWTMLGPGSANI